MDGVISIYKPKGPTSHDVVARVRRLAGTRRVGHCGTLDPMAEGVLVCCVNRATRIVPWLTGLPKEYAGEMVLGASSATYDAEGEITPCNENDGSGVTLEDLAEAFQAQTGMIEQAAPPYSAVKVDGKKLYEYARRGLEVPKKIRTVWVEAFQVVRYLPPRVTFTARVGSGTYIRSLAHDSGLALGCGAYLTKLIRTRVGGFHIDDSARLDLLEADPDRVLDALLPISEALTHMPKLTLSPEAEGRLRHGAAFTALDIQECEGPQPVGEPVLVLSAEGESLAVVQADEAEGFYKPLRVFVG